MVIAVPNKVALATVQVPALPVQVKAFGKTMLLSALVCGKNKIDIYNFYMI